MDIRSEEPPEAEPPAPRAKRRQLWRFVGGILLLFGGVFALIVYTDAEPPEVDDLRGPSAQPARNTYYDRFLRFAAEKRCEEIIPYAEPDDLPEGSPERMPSDAASLFGGGGGFPDFLAAGHGWTPARLASWGPRLALFVEDCATLSDEAAPPAAQDRPPPATSGSPNSLIAAACANMNAAVGMYWANGDRSRAFQIACQLEDFGRRMQECAPGPQIYVAAADASTTAERGLVRLAFLDGTIAKAALERFRHPPPQDPARFRRIIHAAYFDFERLVDEQSVAANAARNYQTPVLFKTFAQTRVLYPWVLKPNLTKTFYADYVRAQAPLIDLNAEEYRRRPEGTIHQLTARDLTRPTNLYGRLLAYQSTWSVQNTINRRTRSLSQRSLLRACLALRVFHEEHGRLPEKLEELVPAYLPEVPIDHANGQTLRYSHELGRVWSAGFENLLIGSADQYIGYNEDYYRLDFAVPAAPPTGSESLENTAQKKAPLAAEP
jgi:hypothetical protein